MPTLADQLGNFVDTINQGPDALDPNLFTGPQDRIILGLKAHANTISHARLIALEETFPMLRNMVGDDVFNALSRAYTETEAGRASDSNMIGAGFFEFLDTRSLDAAATDLAQIEWAWLTCYNAAEAEILETASLATLDEEAMLALPVRRHPAAQMVTLNAPLSAELSELGDTSDTAAILITRPQSEVRLHPVDALTAMIFKSVDNFAQMSNLLTIALETWGQ